MAMNFSDSALPKRQVKLVKIVVKHECFDNKTYVFLFYDLGDTETDIYFSTEREREKKMRSEIKRHCT